MDFSLRAGKVGVQSGALLVCVLAGLLGCSHKSWPIGLNSVKTKLQGVWGVTQLRLSPQNLYRLEPAWSLGLVTCGFLWSQSEHGVPVWAAAPWQPLFPGSSLGVLVTGWEQELLVRSLLA